MPLPAATLPPASTTVCPLPPTMPVGGRRTMSTCASVITHAGTGATTETVGVNTGTMTVTAAATIVIAVVTTTAETIHASASEAGTAVIETVIETAPLIAVRAAPPPPRAQSATPPASARVAPRRAARAHARPRLSAVGVLSARAQAARVHRRHAVATPTRAPRIGDGAHSLDHLRRRTTTRMRCARRSRRRVLLRWP